MVWLFGSLPSVTVDAQRKRSARRTRISKPPIDQTPGLFSTTRRGSTSVFPTTDPRVTNAAGPAAALWAATPLDDALSAWSSAQCDVAGSVIRVDKHNEQAHVFDVPTIVMFLIGFRRPPVAKMERRLGRYAPASPTDIRCGAEVR